MMGLDSAKYEQCIKKRAARSAGIFIQNLLNLLSLNGKNVNPKDLEDVYENMYYAEIERIKATGS